jgi:small basic protein (TIGR04137 family)
MDKTLKTKAALERHRNVLTRAERIEKLQEEARWTEEQSPFGLPKVAHRKGHAGAKAKKAKEKEGEATEGAAKEEEKKTE